MKTDINFLLKFYNKKNTSDFNELNEDDDVSTTSSSPAAGGTTGGSGKTPKKWESGLSRGKANPIGLTVWVTGRKYGKTYMNDPKYVWKSDRVMGKTGGSDYA